MFTERAYRNIAHRNGYHLTKGYMHDIDTGEIQYWNYEPIVGYMLIDLRNGTYVKGSYNWQYDHCMSLEDIAAFFE